MNSARQTFLNQYGCIRAAEGRGSNEPGYYRALPFHDSWQWRIRGASFRYLQRHILPLQPSRILDLGAGNCWLTHRLVDLGHQAVAVDIFTDARDGLQARRHYPQPPPAVEGDFHQLAFAASSFDLAIFNASIHYSPDYARALTEVRRCLRPGGRVVIMDSPVYQKRLHGEVMRAERQLRFEQSYGFRSEALGSIEYFDMDTLDTLALQLNIRWSIHKPWYGWSWQLRPLRARLTRQRPPSHFWILVGSFAS